MSNTYIGLYEHQMDVISKIKKGNVLHGGVGSGKSRTALGYYYELNGGDVRSKKYKYMTNPMDLYIITTARKRDSHEWEGDMLPFLIGTKDSPYNHKVVIDSWNNIGKYSEVHNAFFIFDEQRVVGTGTWVKNFLRITKSNHWILLSATPGDTWSDYVPLFIANGFFKNKTEFNNNHVVWKPGGTFPQILRYLNTTRLVRLRDSILVEMPCERHTVHNHSDIRVLYDVRGYKDIGKTRWNPYKNAPIETPAELCYTWRQWVNSDDSRRLAVLELFEIHPKMIIFYNFNYELDILLNIDWGDGVEIAEWNGRKHQPLPENSRWVYLVQYTAGCEGWNCVTTDTIVFYSQNYSFKVMEQASGRIDRLNTPYINLYYYHLKCSAPIDIAIGRALKDKKKFNERRFSKW